ncbi:hypothetical protein D9M73_224550 [compost metagenome]
MGGSFAGCHCNARFDMLAVLWTLQGFAELNEARPLGEAFIELDAGGVGFVGQPVHLDAAIGTGLCINEFDQFAADPRAT